MTTSYQKYNEITLKTSDNVQLKANYYKNGFDSVIIIAHGWCMTKDSNAFKSIADFFSNYYDILSLDFRGHGKSKGFYTFGAKEINDIDSAVSYLKGYKNIYLFGFSLGAMTSLIYASLNKQISKVIAVSPPADFNKIENKMYKKEAWGETFKKFELLRFLSVRPSVVPYKKIKPIDITDKIEAPTLFIAGRKDPTVCAWHTEELYKKAKCKKKLKVFEDGIHAEDIFLSFKEEFTQLCLEWLSG